MILAMTDVLPGGNKQLQVNTVELYLGRRYFAKILCTIYFYKSKYIFKIDTNKNYGILSWLRNT